MTSILCNKCTYGSNDEWCGLGNVLIDSTCSGYVEGQQPISTARPRLPWWDTPRPIIRLKGRGCQVLPYTDSDNARSYYAMFLDYEEDTHVIGILRRMDSFEWVFNALRLCRWHTAYGKDYTYPLSGVPAWVHVDITTTWGQHKVMVYVRLVLRSLLSGTECQGDINTEVPEQLWWLDPTLPRDMVDPMHQLLGNVVRLYDTHCRYMSPPDRLYINMDASATVLEEVLDLGLRLRGRPLSEWNDALDKLLGRR